MSSDYTTLAEDLASHGYVVVSFDAPYRTVITAFPDGRVAIRAAGGDFDRMPSSTTQHLATQLMNGWIADLKFVLDQLQELNANDPTGRFKGRFDMQKVGVADEEHPIAGAEPSKEVTHLVGAGEARFIDKIELSPVGDGTILSRRSAVQGRNRYRWHALWKCHSRWAPSTFFLPHE